MSVSYTGEASMDEPALRDVERWKDKIEVRLDNRQVFFLFFGSALCACMLFVLGVIVGKRLESRGRAAAPEVQDPLAVLDRINSVGFVATAAGARAEPSLTFPRALIGTSGRGRSAGSAPSAASTSGVPAPPATAVRAPAAGPASSKASASASASASGASSAKVPVIVARAPAAAARASAVPAAKPLVALPVAKPAAAPVVAPVAATAPKGRFTLQLSSFPDRSEAELFAKRFAAQGAYVVISEIPGKGTWYRVRVGSYGSSQEAIAAKGTFEKQNNVIAYIAGR
jgi:DedD protein